VSDAAQVSTLSWIAGQSETDRRYCASNAGRFGFTCAEFAGILSSVVSRLCDNAASERECKRLVDSLRLDELLLARACARGIEKAWDEFITLYRPKLYSAARAIAGDDGLGRELADSLYADLFGTRVGPNGTRVSKLDSYTGRGSLEGWLRALLAQEFVDRHRSRRRLVNFDEEIQARCGHVADETVSSTEQIALVNATDIALAALPSEDRFLLSAHFLDERTLAEIGRMLDVHESTVLRRIEKVTGALRKQIIKELCRNSGMSRRAAEELLNVDVRDLPIDVGTRLAQKERGASFSSR
jgi:RNA polymerase sigma-70 factor (ECF subfamily)